MEKLQGALKRVQSGGLLYHVLDLSGTNTVHFSDLAANFGGELFGLFRIRQIEVDFDVKIDAGHYLNDTMKMAPTPMKCVICEVRTPRRYCPGVRGEICSVCCGTERENTVNCPLDCTYLREARLREKPHEVDPASIPFSDVRIPARFVEDNPRVGQLVIDALMDAISSTAGVIDYDVRQALESLIRTHKTLQSGLVYETRPENPIAASIYDKMQRAVAEGRKEIASSSGVSVRDAEIMSMLLILQRVEYRVNNGRTRGRAFIDSYSQQFPADTPANPTPSPLIV